MRLICTLIRYSYGTAPSINEERKMRQRTFIFSLIAIAAGSLASLAGGASPFHDKPASPQSLPGDNLPPFAMLDANGRLIPVPDIPASALHRGPGEPPESAAR